MTQAESVEYRAKPPPSWSYRPPRAIASQVPAAMASAAGDPVRRQERSRNSATMDGGNFGARPKPPSAAS